MRRIRSIFVLAIIFIVAGAVLTLENLGAIKGISRLWPSFVLILGIGFAILFFERKKTDLVLLWLGSTLCQGGIFFFYLNYTSWAQLASLWPVFLGITGVSFFVLYARGKARIFLFLAVALIMLSTLFYLVFGISLMLWPLSLVAFGVSLLVINNYYLRR